MGNVGFRFNSFAYSSSAAAKELGIEFHIAGSWTGYDNPEDKKADEEKYGIIIHQIDFIRAPYDPRNIKAYKQIIHLIKKEKIDIIHCNTPIGGVIGRLAGEKCGIKPVIYQAHGFHFYDGAPMINWMIYFPIEKWLAHKTDALITINREDYKRAQAFKLRGNGKAYYIPGVGIDIAQYENVTDHGKRKELGIPADAIVLISVGELNRNKNLEIVIRALMEMKNENIHYVLCGEGEQRNHLIELSSSIRERVHFSGYRTDVKELMACSDIFVMPSLREGLSRSLMEAMACGKPCIVSNIRGNKDLIIEGKGGYLCDPKDSKSFADAINLLVRNTSMIRSMGVFNKQAIKDYSLDTVITNVTELYRTEIERATRDRL